MKVYLTKKNRVTTDFVLLEADDKFIYKSAGKVGKSGIFKSTSNAGSANNAIEEIKKETEELTKKGFSVSPLPKDLAISDVVFDKAKWHINDNFPTDLDPYQSYIHTGLYVCWLVDTDLYENDFKNNFQQSIDRLLKRQSTPVNFYAEQLDGIFDASGLAQEAIKFTTQYFDFEKGQYIQDYLIALDPNDQQPSMFYIADTWNNYNKLKPIIDNRFMEWKQTS